LQIYQLVVFHDETVDRTTNGTGKVRSKTLQEMKQLDPGYHYTPDNGLTFPFRGKNLRISSLSEIFDLFPEVFINLELKDDDLLAAELLVEEVGKREGMEEWLVVCGRHCKNLLYFKQLAEAKGIYVHTSVCESEIVKYVLHDIIGSNYLWYTNVRSLLGDVFQIPGESGGVRFDEADFINGAKAIGKRIHYWVINNREDIRKLVLLGADGIITDRVDIAVDVFHELGIKQKKLITDDSLPKKYFIPLTNFEEEHTCVSSICLITKIMLRRSVIYGSVVVTVGLVGYYFIQPPRKSKKD